MPPYIYNIKKSLSIIYTEENPSQGNPPHQFDDVTTLRRRNIGTFFPQRGKNMRPAELIDVEGACDGGEVPPRQRPLLQPTERKTNHETDEE